MMKISILMPTHNDGQYISKTIESVLSQTYKNWELLIMDDGSTDDTASLVNTFTDGRIRFFQQANLGQLMALNNVSSHISGDVVMMLHSDDLLYKPTSLEDNIQYFEDSSIDGIYCSIIQFYPSGKPDQVMVTSKSLGINAPQKLLLLLGSNFIPDPFFIRKEKFLSHVRYNYLQWNTQYWLDYKENSVQSLNLRYSDQPWYYYRIYEANYTNSIIGCFETFLGRLRVIFLLSDYYTVLFPSIQKELMRRFNIGITLPLAASNRRIAKSIAILIKNMKGRTPNAYTRYFEQVQHFYQHPNKKVIELKSKIESHYWGCDGRKFFNDLLNNELPDIYKELIVKLEDGFSSIKVTNIMEMDELKKILKFLCIRAAVVLK
ncbi:MAG: glycosyltransferase [Bacteroidota bacterium]|nr:glycosyltransferase [Bacteroidota bacterium]